MSKLILMDGNSVAFRAFYALPLLSNMQGVYTNAVYGFTMMLMKILEEEKPTHFLVAFDKSRKTFRHDTYKEYKGKREKSPSEIAEQMPLINKVLDAFKIKHFGLENYEADDIIGTFVQDLPPELEVLLVSGDKDLFQLANDQVSVLMMQKGVTEIKRYGPVEIIERYGLTPAQIVDLKGLMGDSSDNIPGIPGVGEKTACKLLAQFPSVEEIIKNVDELPGQKLKDKFLQYSDQALLSKELACIHKEVPLSFTIDDCVLPEMDVERIMSLFRELEFKTLVSRLQDKHDVKPSHGLKEVSFQNLHRFEEGLSDFLLTKQLAVHVEGTEENAQRGELLGLCISNGEQQFFVQQSLISEMTELIEWLQDEKATKVVYNMKVVTTLLKRVGIQINGIVFDVMLAAYLLNPSESGYECCEIVAKYLDFDIPSDENAYGKGSKRQLLQGDELAQHLAYKAYTISQLHPVLAQKIIEVDMERLLYELEMPLAHVLMEMEQHGITVNTTRLHELEHDIKKRMFQLTDEIYELAGEQFNINSPKQLGEILYNKLGLPVLKKTKTGQSTSADVLEKLADEHEIVQKLLYYRQVAKLYSTYIEGLNKEIDADKKIHTYYHQTVTATGRLSSTEPNLQNIPIRLEEGRKIRQIFIPSHPDWYIISADYSQVELRILAHLSADKSLQEAFILGKDIHTQTAADVFGVTESDVTTEMRRAAKAVNFGIIYGISDYGLSQNLNIARKEARLFIDRYFATYPGVKEYMDRIIVEARELGYVTTLLQRRRYLPEINSRDFHRRSFTERTAMNTPIQGTAADIIKKVMVELQLMIKEEKLQSRMLLQVHDELILEAPEDESGHIKQRVKELMEGTLNLSVPLEVEISMGRNWYEAK